MANNKEDIKKEDMKAKEIGKLMVLGTFIIGGFALFLRLVAMRKE